MARQRRTGTHLVPPVLLAMGAALLAGCTEDVPDDPAPSADSVALRVETVEGAGRLDEQSRTELETAVGDVLSHYVVQAYLGEFPRQDFVSAFESFTSGAARKAAGDIEVLTAAPVQEASSVRATRLDARVSFLVDRRDVVGATAKVRFAFAATLPDGEDRALTLKGRLMLMQEDDAWSVFGYDVVSDDGAAVSSEITP